MTENTKHSGIYERLVADDHDVLGQIAYSIYKRRKREFVLRKKLELGTDNLPDSVLADFVNDQTDYTLDLYRDEAQKLSREFLDATYESELSKAVQRLDSQYREKYDELATSLRPHSWWYGVGQSIAASFFFLLAGYVILKMSGSWDILLGSLFK